MFKQYIREGIPFLFVISYDMSDIRIHTLEELAGTKEILYDFNGVSNCRESLSKPFSLTKMPVGIQEYKKAFESVQSAQREGDSYLLNLTFATDIQINLTFEEIFKISRAPYKLKYGDEFVFFSPERFIRIEDGIITTSPMKGTKVRTSDASEAELLSDEKEAAEHLTVVDLLRNDLNMIAEDVTVERYRYVSSIRHGENAIIQTSSDISGRLRDDDYFSALMKLLPAGSICGAPKKRTLEIIRENEPGERGFYTGVSGIFDGKVMDTCVNIRYIEYNNGRTVYKSGGGITVYSNMEDEYKEMTDKVYVPAF